MLKNIGGADRVIRIAVGAAILVYGISEGMPWWTWLGLIPIGTALVRWCPLYLPFKINTAKKEA